MSSHNFTLGRSFLLQGARPTQEDRTLVWEGFLPAPTHAFLSVYAVFDGHNGPLTADIARLNFLPLLLAHPSLRTASPDLPAALRAAIPALDALALSATRAARAHDGATLVAAAFCRGHLSVAHVGDARAVLARRDGPVHVLTADHKLSRPSERLRVAAAAGPTRRSRLLGPRTDLEVTRALGDRDFKDGPTPRALIADPELCARRVDPGDAALLVASDGLWDLPFLDAEAVAAMALAGPGPKRAAEAIVREAIRFGSRDNVALVVVRLHVGRAEVEAGGPEREATGVGEVATGSRPRVPSGFRTVYWEGSRVERGAAGQGQMQTVGVGGDGKGVLRSVSSFLKHGRTKAKRKK